MHFILKVSCRWWWWKILMGFYDNRASSCEELNLGLNTKRKMHRKLGLMRKRKTKVGKYLFGQRPLGSCWMRLRESRALAVKHWGYWGQWNYVTFNSDKLFIPHIIPFPPPPKLKCTHKCKSEGEEWARGLLKHWEFVSFITEFLCCW